MKGYYFVNTDVRNRRAHTTQILSTASFIDQNLPLSIMAPRYHSGQLNLEDLRGIHALPAPPKINFLRNFGVKNPGRFAFTLFNIPASFFVVVKKLKGEKFFIYVRSSFFLPLVVLAKLVGVPVFYESHRIPISGGEKWRDQVLSSLASGIIVISHHLEKYYERYGKRILVVHDAVSLERFGQPMEKAEARKKVGINLESIVGVYTGSVSRLKGLHFLFEAAPQLPQVEFVIAGPVSNEFQGTSFQANVKLLGKKEQSEIPALLQSADVLILPHPRGEYSQSPMKLFEYMASGVPIVASRLPSLTEVLNESNAILVEPENVESLVQGINKAINDPASPELANKALLEVKDYTWEKRGKKISEFIKEVLK